RGAIARERVERQAQPDGGVLVEERLFEAERLAVDADVVQVRAQFAVDCGVDVVEVVVTEVDAVARPGAFVLGDLEAPHRGDDGRPDLARRARREAGVDARRESDGRDAELVAEHAWAGQGHRLAADRRRLLGVERRLLRLLRRLLGLLRRRTRRLRGGRPLLR